MALIIVGMLIWYQRLSPTGPNRPEYLGRIVDKSLTVRESREGSSVVRYLLLEEKGGGRFQVIVNEDIYERAKVGMWIQRNKEGVKLFSSPPDPSSPSTP